MIFKDHRPLSDDEKDKWIDSFPEAELFRHGWSKPRIRECFELYDYVYNTQEPDLAELAPDGTLLEDPERLGAPKSIIFYHFPDVDTLEVLFLATPPFYRQQSAMSTLFGGLIDQVAKDKIWLECREDNVAARRLYAKLGLRETGRRANYYHDGTTAILFNF